MSEDANKRFYRSGLKELSALAKEFVCAECHQETVVLAGSAGLLVACNNPAHRNAGIVRRLDPVTARLRALKGAEPSEMSMADIHSLWER
jgi:glycerol-3-phosphate dehydrogenase